MEVDSWVTFYPKKADVLTSAECIYYMLTDVVYFRPCIWGDAICTTLLFSYQDFMKTADNLLNIRKNLECV